MLHLETQYKNTSYAQKILPVKPSQYIVWEINHLVFKRQEPLKAGLSLTHSNFIRLQWPSPKGHVRHACNIGQACHTSHVPNACVASHAGHICYACQASHAYSLGQFMSETSFSLCTKYR